MNIIHYLSTFIGLTLLCSCANLLVDYSISLSKRLKLSKAFIGVVIIGFGSSLPEVLSVITASKQQAPDLALSTVVGSNIANIGLLLGLSMIITKSWPNMTKNKLDLFFFATSYAILVTLILTTDSIQKWQGVFMVSLLVFSIALTMIVRKNQKLHATEQNIQASLNQHHSLWEQIWNIVMGLVGISIGAHLLIEGAVAIATDFEISKKIIGITLMALGTSLPETAASIAAARKNESKLILGNVVGSNVFNILAALGGASIITPLKLGDFAFDGIVMLCMGLLITPFFFLKKGKTTPYGIVLLILYSIYVYISVSS